MGVTFTLTEVFAHIYILTTTCTHMGVTFLLRKAFADT